MKNDKFKFLLCVLFFVILAAITFRCTWPADQVLSASDGNIGRLAEAKRSLPNSFIGYYTGNQLFGDSGSSINLFRILMAVMPLTFFANAFYGLVLVAGSMSMVWFLRIWGRSWFAAVFGALIAFWVNSILMSVSGHPYKMEVLALSALSLCFIEKAVRADSVRKTAGFSVFCGLTVGIMMIEQQDVALLAGLFVGTYAVFRLVQRHGRAFLRWMALLVPVGMVALLLAGGTMLKAYQLNVTKASSVQGESDDKWNFVTQWSAVPEEWPDLIALGWGGWRSHDPEVPYWGKWGRSAEWESTGQGFRNFKLHSVYLGIIPFLMGIFGFGCAISNRRSEDGKVILFWSIVGLLGLWLAFGKYSLLYKLFFQLPVVNNIRAPVKLLDNFQIILGIIGAYGLDALIAKGKGDKFSKGLWIACAVCGGMMLLAGLQILAFPNEHLSTFAKMGYEPFAEAMVRNMSNAWFHAAFFALLSAGAVFAAWKSPKAGKWIPLVFICAMAGDSLILTSRFVRSADLAALKRGNAVLNYLKENQGNERAYFAAPDGIYNAWLGMDGPFHGVNIFNIWQMPRMPVEYKNFLSTVGRNQVRLWELAAVKHVAAPAGIMQQLKQNPELGKLFKPVLNYNVPTAQGMRPDVLLEFSGVIPRCSLFYNWNTIPLDEQCERLASPQHDSRTTVLIDPAHNLEMQPGQTGFQPLQTKATNRRMTVSFMAEEKAIVRFSQFFRPNWRVFVDGKRAELLRVDYLCMGVAVEPGEHVVEFRSTGGERKAVFMLGVFTVSIAAGTRLMRPLRRGDRE